MMEDRSIDEMTNPILKRLDDQIAWYDRKSLSNRRMYQLSESSIIIAAALLPALAAIAVPVWVMGAIGVFITVVKGLGQLQQYQLNWINYRSTCESLKHEKYLYLASAGDYAHAVSRERLLMERVEGMIARENAAWQRSGNLQVSQVVESAANAKQTREVVESDADPRPVAEELVDKVFNAIRGRTVSGWEVAKTVAEDPGVVRRALNLLRRRGLVESNGIGLDGYYYLTSNGFSARTSMASGR